MFPLRDDRPTYTAPIVTVLLIVACTLVFIYDRLLDDYSRNHFIMMYGVVPARLHPETLVTSMFLHGSWRHIIVNLIFFWAFARSLEDAMGHTKFLALYVICGIVAAIVHVVFNFHSRAPMVGASGAIFGIAGAYLVTYPRAQIRTLFFLLVIFTLDLPAWLLLIFWFLLQIYSGYRSMAQTSVTDAGIAWFAHIGGFIAGMVLVKMMGARQRYFPRRDIYWN